MYSISRSYDKYRSVILLFCSKQLGFLTTGFKSSSIIAFYRLQASTDKKQLTGAIAEFRKPHSEREALVGLRGVELACRVRRGLVIRRIITGILMG